MSQRRIIWLASFPKSGNTWVRTFLANYFLGKVDINELRAFTRSDIRIDFYERAFGRPFRDVSFEEYLKTRQKALRLIHDERPGTHFVKTHHRIDRINGLPLIPPQLTAAAVYMLRNPFDVAPSYARHNGLDLDAAIDLMCDPKAVARSPAGVYEVIGRWDDHIRVWTEAPGLPRVILRYEDLLTNPQKGFLPLFEFLKVPPDPLKLNAAIKAASFDALRKQEDEKGFIERPAHMEKFFHSGKAGGWREALTEVQIAKLHEAFAPSLQKWYPELFEETAAIAGRVER